MKQTEEDLKKELKDVQEILAEAKKEEFLSAGSYPEWLLDAEDQLYGVDKIVKQLESFSL